MEQSRGVRMGTDCTVVVEVQEGGDWYVAAIIHLDRNYRMFDTLRNNGIVGYPSDVSSTTMRYLNELEDWGEGWMPFEKFDELFKDTKLDIIRKKYRKKARIIYRFDN